MLIPAILKVLEQELAENSRRATDTAEGATHEESRPENPKDTRGLEASYLAHGLAKRSAALEEDMRVLRNLPTQRFDKESLIASGAWVTLEDEDGTVRHVALLPVAGGVEVEVSGTRVRVITPSSPLGRALLDRQCGESFELKATRGRPPREWAIVAVRSVRG
ncbi:MAG: GreA/GreB family elongation factor [Myxococcota bacterium]